jgi:F-type H+-transporting ATPase subunit b
MFDVSQPQFWVALAFVLFVFLTGKKITALLLSFLDKRSAEIKKELDTARALRIEAEETLALYRQKQAEFSKEAENILAKARSDAEASSAHAQAELKIALDSRLKQATDKIAQEEAAAIADVRNRIVNLALETARTVIAGQANKIPQDEFIKTAISDIERKIH